MSASLVKGWCPGAYRPMMSGDGLVVRVRPWLGHLDAAQVFGLCDLAKRFGNGTIDLTSRANLQIRGVAEVDHSELIEALQALGLLDADPALESRRNLVVAMDWQVGDMTHSLGQALMKAVKTLPALPDKMGFAIDTGASGQLSDCSADFRFELTEYGALILRADGAGLGKIVAPEKAMDAMADLISWFIDSGGRTAGRMRRHLSQTALPHEWRELPPRDQGRKPVPGTTAMGRVFGAPFGQLVAPALAKLMRDSKATALRPMPGRLFLLMDAKYEPAPDFVTEPEDSILSVHACPGAPFCPQARASTRDIARALASNLTRGKTLHVSGCANGCAYPKAADVTLVGAEGRFNLVSGGAPWDEPRHYGLTPAMIRQKLERL